jgi:hypothetical protein
LTRFRPKSCAFPQRLKHKEINFYLLFYVSFKIDLSYYEQTQPEDLLEEGTTMDPKDGRDRTIISGAKNYVSLRS